MHDFSVNSPLKKILLITVYSLAALSGVGILFVIFITCLDIVLRIFGTSLIGAYDLVRIAGVIIIGGALPYTTAVKGHVAIEFFFHKLNRIGRIITDSITRIIAIALFGILTYQNCIYGISLYNAGEVTSTLQLPIFWLPFYIAFSCFIVILVIIQNLLHPGKEMINP
ncbi:MAG: TRAP transporter small permease [Spirochaetales bacterium]|nr:TRAP transporter small permease [Spirochaetales bacterium]